MTLMNLAEIAAEYRKNAALMSERAKKLRRTAGRAPTTEAYRQRAKANAYAEIARDNIKTAIYLETYYDER